MAKRVDSVEHEEEFYREVLPGLPGNCTLSLEVYPKHYIKAVAQRGELYDIIVIDGHCGSRRVTGTDGSSICDGSMPISGSGCEICGSGNPMGGRSGAGVCAVARAGSPASSTSAVRL